MRALALPLVVDLGAAPGLAAELATAVTRAVLVRELRVGAQGALLGEVVALRAEMLTVRAQLVPISGEGIAIASVTREGGVAILARAVTLMSLAGAIPLAVLAETLPVLPCGVAVSGIPWILATALGGVLLVEGDHVGIVVSAGGGLGVPVLAVAVLLIALRGAEVVPAVAALVPAERVPFVHVAHVRVALLGIAAI